MLRILIADDNSIDRRELKYLLLSRSFSVVGDVARGRDVLSVYGKLKPDLTIVDVSIPDIDACTVIRELLIQDYEAKVMVCGNRGQRSHIVEAMSAGAIHFVLKPYQEDTVVRTIRQCVGVRYKRPL